MRLLLDTISSLSILILQDTSDFSRGQNDVLNGDIIGSMVGTAIPAFFRCLRVALISSMFPPPHPYSIIFDLLSLSGKGNSFRGFHLAFLIMIAQSHNLETLQICTKRISPNYTFCDWEHIPPHVCTDLVDTQ